MVSERIKSSRCSSVNPTTKRRCRISIYTHRINVDGKSLHRAYGRGWSEMWVDD